MRGKFYGSARQEVRIVDIDGEMHFEIHDRSKGGWTVVRIPTQLIEACAAGEANARGDFQDVQVQYAN